jgi:parallel beta-helix repeat protein
MGYEPGGIGIELFNANYSYISNNNFNNQYAGLDLDTSYFTTIFNNTFFNHSDLSIFVQHNGGNGSCIISNNTITESGDSGIGLTGSYNNVISGNKINSSDFAISVVNSRNNYFSDNYASYNNYGVFMLGSSENNAFVDCNFSLNSQFNVFIGAGSTNTTFLNCEYDNSGVLESVGVGSELIRKWYYQANVSDENGNAVKANISVYNVSLDWQFNLSSSASGLTNITEIIDYVNYGGIRSWHSNYTINATNSTLNESHLLNVTLEEVNGIVLDQIVFVAKSVGAQLSYNLSLGVRWNVSRLPVYNLSANGNLGEGVTLYNVTIYTTGTTADLYVKGDKNLTDGFNYINLSNEMVSYSTSDPTVSSVVKMGLTPYFSGNPIGTDLSDNAIVYLKFYLNISPGQAPGLYRNNITFVVVENGVSPP